MNDKLDLEIQYSVDDYVRGLTFIQNRQFILKYGFIIVPAILIGFILLQSMTILLVQPGHVLQVATLPFHHHDPFDRMIIAQAQVEYLTVITHDSSFADYGIKVL